MTGLITGLNMQIHKIIRTQCFQSSQSLPFVISSIKSGCSFYINTAQACIMPYPRIKSTAVITAPLRIEGYFCESGVIRDDIPGSRARCC